MHFTYLQDDWRVNDELTLNARPALRVRDAVGRRRTTCCRTSIPATQHDGHREGRLARRIARRSKPDRNNFGPRLGLAYTLDDRDGASRRLRHQLRALPSRRRRQRAADQRSAGDQRRRRADADAGRFPHDAAGLSGRADRSVALQSAAGEHHLHARGLPLEPTCRAGSRRCSASSGAARCSTSPTSAIAPTACCCSPTQPGGAEQQPPARCRCRRGGRFRSSPTSPIRSTAASRATTRSRPSSTGAWARGFTMLSSLTLSQTKDNGAGSLENPNGNFPAPQDFYNLDADYGLGAYHQPYNSTTSFVIDLPFGSGRRYMSNASPVVDAHARRLADRRHQHRLRRRDGDADLHAGRRVPGRPAFSRTSAAPTTIGRTSSATCWCRKRAANINNWLSRTTVVDPDRSEPAVRQRAAQQRPRSAACGRWTWWCRSGSPMPWRNEQLRVPRRVLQPAQPHELPRAERQPQRRRLRHDHDDLRSADHSVWVQAEFLGRRDIRFQ